MPDCDYGRGEEPLSEEKIKHLAHTFLKYGVIEKRHESLQTRQKVGHVVESYLLPAPASIKGIDGKTRQYPKGTWIVTAEITDEQTIAETQKGVFTGFSATTIPKEVADNVSFKSSQGLLIKDIPNPVGFAVSLVEKPCVHSAKFCKLKHSQNEESNMNEEDKQFLNKLKDVFSFKSDDSRAITQDELDETLASFKSDFKSEIIAGVTQGVAQAVKEALATPTKKKNKKTDGDNGDDEGGEVDGNNTTSKNNTSSTPADEEGEEVDENNTTTESNNNSATNKKKKTKKPPAATKGNKIHDGPQPVSYKSDTQTVYEIMGRNNRGSRIQE